MHRLALAAYGVHLLENIKLGALAQRGRHELAFAVQPLKVQGGSSSTVTPSALF